MPAHVDILTHTFQQLLDNIDDGSRDDWDIDPTLFIIMRTMAPRDVAAELSSALGQSADATLAEIRGFTLPIVDDSITASLAMLTSMLPIANMTLDSEGGTRELWGIGVGFESYIIERDRITDDTPIKNIPDRVEIRTLQAVDNIGSAYMLVRERDSGQVQRGYASLHGASDVPDYAALTTLFHALQGCMT